MTSDIVISVRFFLPSEGGRSTAVSGEFYACPLFVDNEGFDCRLLLRGARLELGSTYEVPVKFLNRDLALPRLAIGKEVLLWEGKNVGRGNIVKIIHR
jgi:hypothetical protein